MKFNADKIFPKTLYMTKPGLVYNGPGNSKRIFKTLELVKHIDTQDDLNTLLMLYRMHNLNNTSDDYYRWYNDENQLNKCNDYILYSYHNIDMLTNASMFWDFNDKYVATLKPTLKFAHYRVIATDSINPNKEAIENKRKDTLARKKAFLETNGLITRFSTFEGWIAVNRTEIAKLINKKLCDNGFDMIQPNAKIYVD